VCSVSAVFFPERAYIFVALTVSDLSIVGFGGIYDMSRASTNMILKLRITILTILVLHFPSPLGIFSSNWIFLLVKDIKRRKHKEQFLFIWFRSSIFECGECFLVLCIMHEEITLISSLYSSRKWKVTGSGSSPFIS
jgi:hypothetical protein